VADATEGVEEVDAEEETEGVEEVGAEAETSVEEVGAEADKIAAGKARLCKTMRSCNLHLISHHSLTEIPRLNIP
jgi:hypothetical protein